MDLSLFNSWLHPCRSRASHASGAITSIMDCLSFTWWPTEWPLGFLIVLPDYRVRSRQSFFWKTPHGIFCSPLRLPGVLTVVFSVSFSRDMPLGISGTADLLPGLCRAPIFPSHAVLICLVSISSVPCHVIILRVHVSVPCRCLPGWLHPCCRSSASDDAGAITTTIVCLLFAYL